AGARRRAPLRALRREPPRRPGARPRREGAGARRRPLQRERGGHQGDGRAGTAPSGDPELRRRGRGCRHRHVGLPGRRRYRGGRRQQPRTLSPLAAGGPHDRFATDRRAPAAHPAGDPPPAGRILRSARRLLGRRRRRRRDAGQARDRREGAVDRRRAGGPRAPGGHRLRSGAGGGLPEFLSSTEEEREERGSSSMLEETTRQLAKDPLKRPAFEERDFAQRAGGSGATTTGDLSAIFKDTSLANSRPDFNSFMKKGDERLRMLEQTDRMPDLQSDFTN